MGVHEVLGKLADTLFWDENINWGFKKALRFYCYQYVLWDSTDTLFLGWKHQLGVHETLEALSLTVSLVGVARHAFSSIKTSTGC